jgi:membrane protein implicated in regulation of membrane protease activity
MSWWGWIIAGATCSGRSRVCGAQFYLVFIGSAAVVVGLNGRYPGLQPWSRGRYFASGDHLDVDISQPHLRPAAGHAPPVHTGPPRAVTLRVGLAPGKLPGRARRHLWTVRNESDVPIPPGTRVRVFSVHGLTLLVRHDV